MTLYRIEPTFQAMLVNQGLKNPLHNRVFAKRAHAKTALASLPDPESFEIIRFSIPQN